MLTFVWLYVKVGHIHPLLLLHDLVEIFYSRDNLKLRDNFKWVCPLAKIFKISKVFLRFLLQLIRQNQGKKTHQKIRLFVILSIFDRKTNQLFSVKNKPMIYK